MITFFVLFTLLVCLIINFSIDRTISWSLYPIGALIVVWSIVSPLLLMNKYRFSVVFAGLTISAILYLLLIQNLVAQKGWFLPLALPIAILSLSALEFPSLFLRDSKPTSYMLVAVSVFLFGVVVNLGVGLIVSRFIKEVNCDNTSKVLTTVGSAMTRASLVIAGYIRGIEYVVVCCLRNKAMNNCGFTLYRCNRSLAQASACDI